jgi:uncharacterized membrane protein YfhO
LKKIAFDGYNNFILKSFKQFNDSPGHIEKLKYPVLHWEDSQTLNDSLFVNSEKSIEILSFSPTNLKANVFASEKSQIIFLQSDYPGWQVKLDGMLIPHFKKENIFIAADIPAGKHHLEFDFYPKNFSFYLGFSTFFFLLSAFGIFRFRKD